MEMGQEKHTYLIAPMPSTYGCACVFFLPLTVRLTLCCRKEVGFHLALSTDALRELLEVRGSETLKAYAANAIKDHKDANTNNVFLHKAYLKHDKESVQRNKESVQRKLFDLVRVRGAWLCGIDDDAHSKASTSTSVHSMLTTSCGAHSFGSQTQCLLWRLVNGHVGGAASFAPMGRSHLSRFYMHQHGRTSTWGFLICQHQLGSGRTMSPGDCGRRR